MGATVRHHTVERSSDARPRASAEKDLQARVVQYYDQATIDYRLVWQNHNDCAFHFGYYDETTTTHPEALQNANRVLADVADIRKGNFVLDAGCGVGGSAFWLAEHRGASVLGITPVPGHVQRARQLAGLRGIEDRVRFKVGDYTSTGIPDATVDVAWALESSCHASDKPSFYREMFRVLRPGGRLVIADYLRSDKSLTTEDEQVVRDWLDGWAIPCILTGEEHRRHATDAGFENA